MIEKGERINEDIFSFYNNEKKYSMLATCYESDNVHPKFIRLILPLILPFMTHLFNTIFILGTYPIKWKHAKIVPVLKSLYTNSELHRLEQSMQSSFFLSSSFLECNLAFDQVTVILLL